MKPLLPTVTFSLFLLDLCDCIRQGPPPAIAVNTSPFPCQIAGMGPILRLIHPAMMHWIVVNIAEMMPQILFISNYVIPKTFLPELHRPMNADGAFVFKRKVALEQMHDLAKGIADGRSNQEMEMIGQEDKAQHVKWLNRLHPMQHGAQQIQMVLLSEDGVPSIDNLGQEDDGVWDVVAADTHNLRAFENYRGRFLSPLFVDKARR
jgi:hypothetical protein